MEYFSSKLLPLIIGGTILLLAAIELVRELLKPADSEISAAEGEVGRKAETGEGWRGYLTVGYWTAAFVLSTFVMGLIPSIALVAFSYMKWHGTRWVVAITIAIITTLVCYVSFELLMDIELYRGFIFEEFIEY